MIMYVEIHLLQSFAPSNLNRDDTGSPKECTFGGVRRARISSQCLKRAMRTDPSFAEATGVPIGERTRRVSRALLKRLVDAGITEEQATPIVNDFVRLWTDKDAKAATVSSDGITAAQFYVSQGELDDAAAAIRAEFEALVGDKKTADKARAQIVRNLAQKYGDRTSAPDVALFGRMMASRPELNLDAACQVAHALSTHRIAMEMDFFTAVDDLVQDAGDETGAGMMGVLGYASACYYRYARIDWDQLVKNLDGDLDLAAKAVDGLLRASMRAVPSGKQNSHAANNPPSLALAVVRESGMAWSLANAFERPVRAEGEGGYVAPSLTALDTYWGELCAAYGQEELRAVAALRCGAGDVDLPHLASQTVAGEAAWRQAVLAALQPGR